MTAAGGDADPRHDKVRAVYDALAGKAASKTRGNLERLRNALESMRQRRQADYGYAAAARAVADLGYDGPSYSSIKNGPGQHFRTLIDAYDEAYGARRAQRAGGEDEDLPAMITDPKLRARVGMIVARSRALQERNDLLHDQYRRLTAPQPAAPGPPALPPGTPAAGGGAPQPVAFTEDEREAVRRFLRGLERQGWHVDDATGAIKDHRDAGVAPPYFVDALRKVAG